MTILVDSDVLIEVTRARDQRIVLAWLAMAGTDSTILCSAISIAELWHGAREKEYTLLDNLFRSIQSVDITALVARKAGEYLQKYRKSHQLELGDALIAASAFQSKAHLWTRNKKHYPMQDLKLWNPQDLD